MPPIMNPLVTRVSRARATAAPPAVVVHDYMLSPAAVAEREKRLLREAQVARQSQHGTDTEGG